MLRLFTVISFALILVACDDGAKEVEQAKKILKGSLGLHASLEFSEIEAFPGGVVCGRYSTTGYRPESDVYQHPFLTVRGRLYKNPSQEEWAIFCSRKPAEALFEKTGIGPYDSGNADMAKITADLHSLTIALESYYRDHFYYPAMAQGLQALVSPPDNLITAKKYPEGGYLQSVPEDPWGRPYLYEEEQWGRTKGNFTITTLGADGTEGGAGKNADTSTAHLPYLTHIAIILGQL